MGSEAGLRMSLELSTEYQRVMFSELVREVTQRLGSSERVRLWSAGSGIDPTSLRLKKMFGNSVDVLLLDLSGRCVDINKQLFARAKLEAEFETGDVFESHHRDEFDVVFNTGLLEHFDLRDQERLFGIFSESLRVGGSYVTVTPSSGGKVYNFCRRRMMARGTWAFGPEVPVTTFRGLDSHRLVLIDEHPVAPLDQITIFIPQAFPLLRLPSKALRRTGKLFSWIVDPILMRSIGGYCLFDKFVKR